MPTPDPIRHKIETIWRGLALAYGEILRAIIGRDELPPAGSWEAFLQGFIDGLQWTDLAAATALRRRAHAEKLIIPDARSPDLQSILRANPWAMSHATIMHPLIEQRASWIRRVEDHYISSRADSIRELLKNPEKREKFRPIYRLDMMRRDAMGEVAAVSEQVQLANPYISEAFPMAQYRSRDDARTRPTHQAMHNFLALRSWSGWPICRYPCGFNCRCGLRFFSRFECIKHGWVDTNGKPRFELLWPNSLAERNFKEGLFPDPGWRTPRFWSFAGPIAPEEKVA